MCEFIRRFSNICLTSVLDGSRCHNIRCTYAHPKHIMKSLMITIRKYLSASAQEDRTMVAPIDKDMDETKAAKIRADNAKIYRAINKAQLPCENVIKKLTGCKNEASLTCGNYNN